MHTVSVPVGQGLGREIGAKPVLSRYCADDGVKGNGIVRRSEGIGVPEVNLILSRTTLVVGSFRTNSHLLQHQTDLAADVFTFVIRSNIHIPSVVIRNFGRLALFIYLKEVKLHFCAKCKGIPLLGCIGHRLFQNTAGVTFECLTIRVGDVAKHPHKLPLFRSPGKLNEGGCIGVQQEIRSDLAAKSTHCRSIDGNAELESTLELTGHDGHIMLLSIDIAECQSDEFDIFFLHKLHHFFWGILHNVTCFLFYKSILHNAIKTKKRCCKTSGHKPPPAKHHRS